MAELEAIAQPLPAELDAQQAPQAKAQAEGQPGQPGPADRSPQGSASTLPQVQRNLHAVRNGAEFKQKNRTIVVCLDGTGDKFDDDNSNIVHLVSCLKKADPSQVIYYQSGIGTYDGGGLSNGVNAALDMAVGAGLGVHVRDAYRFLMQNYSQGDKICMFGFSRGAYTARCLAGMVHKVGLLPAHNSAQVPFAYQYYKDDTAKGWKMSAFFKRTFCMDVSVYFLGVFDSVASVGVIPRKLPLSSTPLNRATYFRHAMALDERRAKFKPCRFQTKNTINEKHWDIAAESEAQAPKQADHSSLGTSTLAADEKSETKATSTAGSGMAMGLKKAARVNTEDTDVLEVWFAGCHADVGGGAVANEVRNKLSQVPLRWMIRQCFECDTGIIFKAHRLAEEGIDVQTVYPRYTSLSRPTENVSAGLRERFEKGSIPPIKQRPSALTPVSSNDLQGLYHVNIRQDASQEDSDAWLPEQAEDYFDAVQPINDQLSVGLGWWILEVFPVKVRIQPKDSDTWIKKVRMNLGRHRAVQEKAPNLHWTVEERMRAKGYKINARVDKNASWQVVV